MVNCVFNGLTTVLLSELFRASHTGSHNVDIGTMLGNGRSGKHGVVYERR